MHRNGCQCNWVIGVYWKCGCQAEFWVHKAVLCIYIHSNAVKSNRTTLHNTNGLCTEASK